MSPVIVNQGLTLLRNTQLRSAEIIPILRVREPDLNLKASKEKFLSAFLNVAMQHEQLIPYKLK